MKPVDKVAVKHAQPELHTAAAVGKRHFADGHGIALKLNGAAANMRGDALRPHQLLGGGGDVDVAFAIVFLGKVGNAADERAILLL